MTTGDYMGITSKAHKGKNRYIGIENKARKVKKGYIGVDGKARLFYTSGLGNWNLISTPSGLNLKNIIYENGKFLVTPSLGNTALYSYDGITWNSAYLGVSNNWYSPVYGSGKFILLCTYVGKTLYSKDGISWDESTFPSPTNYQSKENYWNNMAFGNNIFVALGYMVNKIAISTDGGNSWTKKDSDIAATNYYGGFIYAGGKFVAVAQGYSGSSKADRSIVSTDGETWSKGKLPAEGYWSALAYGAGKYVTLCANHAAYSTDGLVWYEGVSPAIGTSIQGIAYGKDVFVAPAYNSDIYLYSYDGIIWNEGKLPKSSTWRGVTYGNGKFIIVSEEDIVYLNY